MVGLQTYSTIIVITVAIVIEAQLLFINDNSIQNLVRRQISSFWI